MSRNIDEDTNSVFVLHRNLEIERLSLSCDSQSHTRILKNAPFLYILIRLWTARNVVAPVADLSMFVGNLDRNLRGVTTSIRSVTPHIEEIFRNNRVRDSISEKWHCSPVGSNSSEQSGLQNADGHLEGRKKIGVCAMEKKSLKLKPNKSKKKITCVGWSCGGLDGVVVIVVVLKMKKKKIDLVS